MGKIFSVWIEIVPFSFITFFVFIFIIFIASNRTPFDKIHSNGKNSNFTLKMLTACHLWHMFCHFQKTNHKIHMKKYLIYCLVIISSVACNTPQKHSEKQGLSGKVVWFEGNLMPTLGDSTYLLRAKGKPVQRQIWVYEATTINQVKVSEQATIFSEVNTPLIRKFETDENGEFQANIKPGKYSLFTLEEDGLFANVFDGQGIINPVTVEVGKFTEIVIKVNYKAVY